MVENYSKRVRSEREEFTNQVDRLKDAVKTFQKKWQELASTIQALEEQLESRKRGRDEEERQTNKESHRCSLLLRLEAIVTGASVSIC